MSKWVYNFGDNQAEGNASMGAILGGKGANLAEMSNLGLAVPPGFTITTEVCAAFYQEDRRYPTGLDEQVKIAIANVEKTIGAGFGDAKRPLLVSVRSGARASMPGMMDTVLNLGLNDQTVVGLARASNNEWFAWDSYRRFIQMYGNVVLGIEHYRFEQLLDNAKSDYGVSADTDLPAESLETLVSQYKKLIVERTNEEFPQDPISQLWGAITAVFGSWMNQRAQTYRRINGIPSSWGTAVNVQAMVFGNMGETSATGVAFTRNPSTGEKVFFGEFLINAQGEDVVAGIRTPRHLTKIARMADKTDVLSMQELMPEVYLNLVDVYQRLETHYRDMQDVEFTVQQGKLWILQTRSGKRTAKAAVKIAVDMVHEGLITEQDAICRVDPSTLDQLLHPMLDPSAHREVLASGLPASPGAASGEIVFTSDEAERLASLGKKVILVREETSPEDIHGMHASEGILTSRGGMTSHAAVVARGMGKPCVSGVSAIRIDVRSKNLNVGTHLLQEGDQVTIDGSRGDLILGEVAMMQPELSGDFVELIGWADNVRVLDVRANAETPNDAKMAREFGAEGIGLCRTEHMFFDADRIVSVRQMILADDEMGRKSALDKLLPMQRQDFIELFRIMHGYPVTVRLLDPPLHEFLPHTDAGMAEVAEAAGTDLGKITRLVASLREMNPMLGHRGCRLGISFPEIYEMQARAIFEAALQVGEELSAIVAPEIMLPLVATRREVEILKSRIDAVAAELIEERQVKLHYLVGTMIELPRAALRSDEIAKSAEFFSFGTNDLTQTTLGISRDDAANFLGDYLQNNIFPIDPFVSIDQIGVGELVKIGTERGRAVRADLKVGICGEHGGDPQSIDFFHKVGLDYVSASPYRVPIARLAAAQAALKDQD